MEPPEIEPAIEDPMQEAGVVNFKLACQGVPISTYIGVAINFLIFNEKPSKSIQNRSFQKKGWRRCHAKRPQ
jgi:hypothetical protein